MRAIRRPVTRAVALVLISAAIVCGSSRAHAVVVGTGRLEAIDFDGSLPNLTFAGGLFWDDASFDVLGTPVNLGVMFPGEQSVVNGFVTSLNLGDVSAEFMVDLLSASATGGFLNLTQVIGSAVCTQPTCLNATATFLGQVSSVTVWPADLLPTAPLAYFLDGSIALNPSFQGSGPFGLNAFLRHETPVGTAVTVGSGDDTFYDSLADAVLPFAAEATFAEVSDAGSTSFIPLSTAEGTIPASIQLAPGGGLTPVFIDVVSTASYTGPVEVCIVVPNGVTLPLDQLRILHREGPGAGSPAGAFVDVTTGTKSSPTRVCGAVASLSPFVLGLDTTPPTTTTSTTTSSTSTSSSTTSSVTSTTTQTTGTTIPPTSTSTTVTTTTTTTDTVTIPSTTVTSTTTTSSSSTSSSTTSTSLPPGCDDAPTFASILCRLGELIVEVEASEIPDPTKRNLLSGLTATRDRVAEAAERADAGATRGAKSRLKGADRRMTSVLFRLRSRDGVRAITDGELREQLMLAAASIQDDLKTLRGDL